jgi:hypothetical protein
MCFFVCFVCFFFGVVASFITDSDRAEPAASEADPHPEPALDQSPFSGTNF